jgi:hypothetical protein
MFRYRCDRSDGLVRREDYRGEIMDSMTDYGQSRKNVAIRFIYALFFLVVFELVQIVLQVTVLFQYVYLLITKKRSEPVIEFSNKLATYAYKIIRYITLNEKTRPFPFSPLSEAMEEREEDDIAV